MDLEGIADFIALSDTLSFSKAAGLRNVTQPAFSRRIKSLEERLEVELVDRRTTPISLTNAGQRFLVHAKLLKKTMDKAVEEAQSQVTALTDPVHIVTSHSLSVNVFPHWYRAVQRDLPKLKVRLASQRIERCVTDVREGTADLGIIHHADTVRPFDLQGMAYKRIGVDTMLPVIAKHQRADDHDKHGLLSYAPGSYLGLCSDAILADIPAKKRPRVVFENPSGEVLRSMTLAGFGMACLTETLIEDDLREGFLIPAFGGKHKLDLSILLLRSARPLSPMAEAVWEQAEAFV